MLLKRPQHKRFDYIPRYYNPDTDPERKRREKFRFRTHVRKGKRPSFAKLILWFLAAVVIYLLLAG